MNRMVYISVCQKWQALFCSPYFVAKQPLALKKTRKNARTLKDRKGPGKNIRVIVNKSSPLCDKVYLTKTVQKNEGGNKT